ncbi:MAG: DNA gyrase subunit A, partial [Polyangiaceae bacterium]|nr:DNA gyrase subunit A [Polyangiaceae bacterium]
KLRAILADENLLMSLIVSELEEVKEKHQSERRTHIEDSEAEINLEDLIQEEDMVVTISHSGYIKRTAASIYESQKRGGKGKRGMQAQTDDWVSQLFVASTHALVFFFSDLGKVYVKKVYQVPQAARNAKGRAIVNFIGLEEGERITAIAPVEAIAEDRFVITLTKQGKIKKTPLVDYKNFREKGIIGVRIEEEDRLLTAAITDGSQDLIIGTRGGKSIRFDESQVRSMGRNTAGVKGIDLADDDVVVGLGITDPERAQVLAICERGYGKRTSLDEYRQQKRGGKGIKMIDASERNGPVVGIAMVHDGEDLVLMTDKGQTIRTRLSEVRETGRNAQGVRVMKVASDERVVAIETIAEREEDDVNSEAESSPQDNALDSSDVENGATDDEES